MDLFYTKWAGEIDLDDPDTYKSAIWDDLRTTHDLRDYAYAEIGKSFVYMDFMHEHMEFAQQRKRVRAFAETFAKEFWTYIDNTEENRQWWRKFIFKFNDEVDNQC